MAQRAGTGELHLARLLCVPAPASGLAALNVSKEERGQAGVSSALRCFWRPAGLLVRALEKTARIQPGFATDHRMYIRLVTPQPDFTPDTRLFTRLLSETRVLPGVTDATLSFGVLAFSDGTCQRGQGGLPAHSGRCGGSRQC